MSIEEILLNFIGDVETGKKPPVAYETLFAHRQGRLPRPLTSMTVDEVIAAGATWSSWTPKPASSAAGRYQFMRATLIDLKRSEKLTGREVFTPALQDRLGLALLKRRGYDAWVSGKISDTEFGNRLAMEWASLPVLSNIKGAHRNVTRGQSYYAGDGVNKSLTKPEQVEAVLWEAKHGSPLPPDYEPPVEGDESPRSINWLAVIIIAAIVIVGIVVLS